MPTECFHWLAILVAASAFYAVMLDLCEDRPNCVVRANPETFTQDPCAGTSKYLEAHYKCRPNEFERQTACEGEELHISCGRGDRIAVFSAMFGRTPNGTDKCRANKQGYIDCQATGALVEVNTHCQGRRSCAILANESVFGDPCVSGINKYLTVSYACVPKKILKRQYRKVNNKKRKKKKKKKDNEDENATNITTETGMSDTLPTTHVDHPLLQPSVIEVYEAVEQMIVTQIIPVPGTDSASENINFLSLKETGNGVEETTTIHNNDGLLEGNIFTRATDMPKMTHRRQPIDNKNAGIDNNDSGTKGSYAKDIRASTESSVSTFDVNKGSKDMNAEYNTQDSYKNKEKSYQNHNNTDINQQSNNIRNVENQPSNQKADNSQTDTRSSINNQDQISSGAESTQSLNTTLNSASRNKSKGQISKTNNHHAQTPNSKSANGNNVAESPFVTERNLTILCMNYTRPDVRWGGMVRPKDERTIGFLRDWFSAMYFLQMHQEKAWLYFTLGICFGIIVMLIVVLIKVCINFRRNIRARLDVSEPTHRNTHTNNHSSLDAPMLEHSDSMDRIEVVRFSPRNTLRGHRSNSHHRDLVNYYG